MPNFDVCVLDDRDGKAQLEMVKQLAEQSGSKIAPQFNQFCQKHRTNHFIDLGQEQKAASDNTPTIGGA